MGNIILNDDIMNALSSSNNETKFKCIQKQTDNEVFYDCSIRSINKKKEFHIYFILLITSLFMFAAGWVLIWSITDYITEVYYPSNEFSYQEQLIARIPLLSIIFLILIFSYYFVAKKLGRNPEDHV